MGKYGYVRTRDDLTRTRPDPLNSYPIRTRTHGYGSGRVNPRVWVNPQTPSENLELNPSNECMIANVDGQT